MTQLPAVVTIPDLPAGTAVTGTELFEAVQTSGGVGNSVKLTLSQMVTGVVGGLPSGGGTGQILLASGTGLLSQWANISSNVLASTGLAQAGSTTVSLSLASTAGLSVLGVGGTGSAVPAPIVGTADQVLIVNHAGNTAQFGAVNLATSAAVTGILPVPNGGTNTSTLTLNGVLYGNAGAAVGVTAQGAASSVLAGNAGIPSFTATPTVGQLAIAPTVNTLSTGLTVNMAVAGTFTTSNSNLNFIGIAPDNANLSTQFGVGLQCLYTFGGSSMQGGRTAIAGNANLGTTTSSSNLNRNYVGVSGLAEAVVNDNGIGTANASAAGAIFGGNFAGVLGSSAATAFLNLSGCEFNTQAVSGASMWAKSLAQFSSLTGDKVQGAAVDAMLWLYNQSTGNPGWNNGILIDNSGGVGAWPISSSGTIFKTGGGGNAALGVDISNTVFSTAAFKSNNFFVDPSGFVNSGGFTRITSNFSTATTTLAAIPGLVASMATGAAYKFEALLYCTAGSTGGTQIEITASAPITSIVYDAQAFGGGALVGQGRATTIAPILISTSATTPTIRIVGLAQCGNTACSLIAAIAQQASTTTATQVLAGSTFEVFRVT